MPASPRGTCFTNPVLAQPSIVYIYTTTLGWRLAFSNRMCGGTADIFCRPLFRCTRFGDVRIQQDDHDGLATPPPAPRALCLLVACFCPFLPNIVQGLTNAARSRSRIPCNFSLVFLPDALATGTPSSQPIDGFFFCADAQKAANSDSTGR